MKKLPKLPKNTKVVFCYRSAQFVNLVSVNKKSIRFFLWDEVSEYPTEILEFPREYIVFHPQEIIKR